MKQRDLILIAFVLISLLSTGTTALITYNVGVSTLEKETFNKLTIVRELKGEEIEDYFEFIFNQIKTTAYDPSVVDAMNQFSSGFTHLESELDLTQSEISVRETNLHNYYLNEFLPRIPKDATDLLSISDYDPVDVDTILLQSMFISENVFETGSKHWLLDPDEVTTYGSVHNEYHPIFKDFVEHFGYYDLFLVDTSNDKIIYSVFKEIDFGTSLVDGPYSNSAIGNLYQNIKSSPNKYQQQIEDFAPYAPSYYAPASFVGISILDGNTQIGVLIFQLPIDRINTVMTSHENWKNVGLGDSGETYIVGSDKLLRSESRFLIEDEELYLKQITDSGSAIEIVNQIDSLHSSIGLQEVDTTGTRDALQGNTGTATFNDYRDVSILSSYRPLNIEDLNWVIMSEIDEAEAFEAIDLLTQRIILGVIALFVASSILSVIFSRRITKPIFELVAVAEELEKGNMDVNVPQIKGLDEISSLGNAFETMRIGIKKLIDDLEEFNKTLENKVDQRTEELQKAHALLEIANERMLTELEFAREIQMSMVPLTFPAYPDRKEIELDAKIIPAREVGGDFYDFYFLDNNHFCFVIADVSGKGAPGALLMAVSKTLIKSRATDDFVPSSIITHVNNELSANNESCMFVTAFLAVLNFETGLVQYTNAGHNPPFIVKKDGTLIKLDDLHGPVIGAVPNLPYKQSELYLDAEDLFFLYTDGVTEAEDKNGNMYTEDRLIKFLNKMHKNNSKTVVEPLLEDIRKFTIGAEQYDDITMLAIDYLGFNQFDPKQKILVQIENTIEQMPIVEEKLEEFCKEFNVPDLARQNTSVVVDEMLNNIITYAFDDDRIHLIDIQFTIIDNRLITEITDDGIPFNPFQQDPPNIKIGVDERELGGLGIHLVKNLMNEYSYRRQVGKNILTTTKFFSIENEKVSKND